MVYVILTLKNWGFWLAVVLALLVSITAYIYLRSNQKQSSYSWLRYNMSEFTLGESFGTMGIVLLIAFVTTLVGVSVGSDLDDFSYINGKVTRVAYYEPWDELVTYTETTTDSKGNVTVTVKTRVDYHGPRWEGETDVDSGFNMGQAEYLNYRTFWGNETHVAMHRSVHSSSYRGDKFVVNFPGDRNRIVPYTTTETGINYLKASYHTVERRLGSDAYRGLVLGYPSIHNAGFGGIRVSRLLCNTTSVPAVWQREVERVLAISASELGPAKQCNPLLYIVNTKDQAFIETLDTAWLKGKKNDVIVLVGCTQWPNIDWVHTMAWTDSEEFRINLRNSIMAMGTLDDGHQLVANIEKAISRGYVRKPMEDFAYLLSDAEIPTSVGIVTLILSIIGLGVCIHVFKNN